MTRASDKSPTKKGTAAPITLQFEESEEIINMTNKLNKSDLQGLLRIHRTNMKAAKATIMARGAGMKARYEMQLDAIYPPDGDPIWQAELEAAVKACEPHIQRVNARSDELGIGEKFRPRLTPPSWSYGGAQLFTNLRNDMRRVAHVQIDAKLKSDVEMMERQGSAWETEVISNGFVTPAAAEFMAKLPTIDQLAPPWRLEDVVPQIEAKAPEPQLGDRNE
jgi:hypothetical protein